MIIETNIWLAVGLVVLGGIAGYILRRWYATRAQDSLEKKLQSGRERAESESKDIVLKAKEQAAKVLSDLQDSERERKKELRVLEERLLKREDVLDKERMSLGERTTSYEGKVKDLETKEEEVQHMRDRIAAELEQVAGLSKDEAKQKLLAEVEEGYKEELTERIVTLERKKQEEIEKKTLDIITSSIQRYARDNIADITTSVVMLPDEDLKGKIIGREGRNIRTFERLTGVELIVDESPDSIILSSFDPLRREVARIALEKLIKDGRIQPARIEEKVEEAREELEKYIRKVGEETAYEVGILDFPSEILTLLGRLKYRTSYGQNVLQHSIEMAHIAGMIAAELGIDVDVAKKGALVHDIGKAIDHEVEGTHVELGRKLLKKYGIDERIIRAMESHHEEYPFATPESYVVAAADVISAARPGARRETLEKYLRRLEEIEKVVKGFDGIEKVYAISAGREVRVFVVPEKIDDFAALQLAKKIANKIKSDVQYPGEIKVTVIREVRAVEFAK